jgi:hypothetical protein
MHAEYGEGKCCVMIAIALQLIAKIAPNRPLFVQVLLVGCAICLKGGDLFLMPQTPNLKDNGDKENRKSNEQGERATVHLQKTCCQIIGGQTGGNCCAHKQGRGDDQGSIAQGFSAFAAFGKHDEMALGLVTLHQGLITQMRREFAPIVQKRVPFEGFIVAARLWWPELAIIADRYSEGFMTYLTSVYWYVRGAFVGLVMALVLSLASPLSAFAEEGQTGLEPWQSAITQQIEAFRRGDAETALSFAAFSFQVRYRDQQAAAFVRDVERSGYGPILSSRAHSFGAFRVVEQRQVLQVVKLTGGDLGLYQALYQLRQEPDGWRVESVMLRKQPGLSI